MSETPADLLKTWLARTLSPEALAWLENSIRDIQSGKFDRLAIAFSLATRRVGKHDLALAKDDIVQAGAARPRWNPSRWTADHAARTLLVLALPSSDPAAYVATLDRLFAASDVGELVALYQALPLYPHADRHKLRAAEGVRSNIKAVFEAVAHRNPYPAEQFDEGAWNQMILKCLFVGSRLDLVVAIGGRTNPNLAQMLVDYAKERRAAGRAISPELWRCVGPFASDETVEWLTQLLHSGHGLDRQAAALALAACRSPKAKDTITRDSEAMRAIDNAAWTWASIAKQLDAQEGLLP